jgi:O-acetyl-ADP-ribose deacetylase (regulator of RNase III)
VHSYCLSIIRQTKFDFSQIVSNKDDSTAVRTQRFSYIPGAGVGGVAVLARDNRFIYYLITKERYYEKPTLASLKDSLLAAKSHCLEHSVTRLSMPRIGCGLDGLSWSNVSRLIQDVFADSNVAITVYVQ